jgi:sugar lactone lactonase YvrE
MKSWRTEGFVAPTLTAVVSTYAGTGIRSSTDGNRLSATFSFPSGIAIDSAGNLYICSSSSNNIRKIDTSGNVTTIAGSTTSGSTNANGTSASFQYPYDCVLDNLGNLYIADCNNNMIRKIDTSGNVTTIAGSTTSGSTNANGTLASFYRPRGITRDSAGNLYVADTRNNIIRKIDTSGNVTTYAGNGTAGIADGNGTSAIFNNPSGITIDSAGNLYVCDYANNRIRKIDTSRNVTTIAGNSIAGSRNGIGTSASFINPTGITIDSVGNLYICNHSHNNIRKIDTSRNVTTIAGSGTFASGSADGNGLSATFNRPVGIAVDLFGNLYISDFNNHRIRKITMTLSCGSSQYNNAGSCTPLPTNSSLNSTMTGYVCDTNYYNNGTSCTPLPDNSSLNSTMTGYVCNTNYYNNGTSCIACPSNATCTATGYTCNPGFSNTGSACQELSCNPGRYRSGLVCLSCGAGTYSSTSNALTCTACGANTYASTTGQSSCTPCPENATCAATDFTCSAGYTKSGSFCQQVTCPAGQYVNGSTCTPCPSSTYQPQSDFTGNSCKAIPPTNVASSTASSVTCEPGFTLNADGTQCEANPCTEGVNYNRLTGNSPCSTCPLHSVCTTTGYTCETGYSQLGNGCSPDPCAIGSYSTSGKMPCTPCETGYTNTETGQTSSSSCKMTIQVADILDKLNYSPTNIPGQFFGLTAANINISGPQTFSQGETINYLSYVTPASLVTAAAINYINGTTFNLTNPQGKPVNNQGNIPMIVDNLPPGTQGSIYTMNTRAMVCTGITPDTCTFIYNVPGGGTQSTNPCPSMNSFYDFDKGFCVDKNGNRVTTTRSCDSSSLYNKDVNDCLPVREPYFKSQPPNTTGKAVPGDFTNCLTITGSDCQPLYTIGTTKSTTNPCSGATPIYDFSTRSCKSSNKTNPGATCCSLGINTASSKADCAPYVKTTTTKNTTLCAARPSACCNNQALSTNATCKKQKYWIDSKSFKPGACSITGFIDIGDETMQNKVRRWAENRKMLNIP